MPMLHPELSKKILDVFFRVYDEVGPDYLEAIYERAMAIALRQEGLTVTSQLVLPYYFRGIHIGTYKVDLAVEETVLVELKAGRAIHPAHEAQLRHYLRGSRYELGFLLNFGPKPSFHRTICSNDHKKPVST